METIESLSYNTQTGDVYIYLKTDKYKKKKLYSNGNKYFVKNKGYHFFNNENDIKRINDFINN